MIHRTVLKELKQYILSKQIPSEAVVGIAPIIVEIPVGNIKKQCKYCNSILSTKYNKQSFAILYVEIITLIN